MDPDVEIPWEVHDLLNFYSLPWPDIEARVFHELQPALREFGRDLEALADAIDGALQVLASGNPSHTLHAVRVHFDAVRRNALQKITNVVDDLAGWPCDVGYDAIVAVKWAILGTLTGEVLNDAADIASAVVTLGADTPEAAYEAIAVREAALAAMRAAEAAAEQSILAAAEHIIDDWVNGIVHPFIARIEGEVEHAVDSYTPAFVMHDAMELDRAYQAEGGDDRLHLSPIELARCVEAIVAAGHHLDRANVRLETIIEGLFDHPSPNIHMKGLSSELRILLKNVAQTVREDLLAAVRVLVNNVIQHFKNLLHDYERAVDELDQRARQLAGSGHYSYTLPVTVVSAEGAAVAAVASVAVTTGAVNATEADRVQVSAATEAESAEELAVKHGTVLPAESAGPAVVHVDELQRRDDNPTVAASAVASGGHHVEEMRVHHGEHGVSAETAAAGAGPNSTVSAHRHEEHGPAVAQAHGASAAHNMAHLHARHSEDDRPRVGTAQGSSAHSVHGVSAHRADEPRPTVNPVPSDSDDGDEV